MTNQFCNSHMSGEYDTDRQDCRELSLGRARVQCPYTEEHIQLRYVEGHPQLHITRTEFGIEHHCIDFIPTPEARSRLIQKLTPTNIS